MTYVWKQGMPEWKPINDIEDLKKKISGMLMISIIV